MTRSKRDAVVAVKPGSAGVSNDTWDSVTVSGAGEPIFEKLASVHKIKPTPGKALVTVLTKLDASGIQGSRYVVSGVSKVSIAATRVFEDITKSAKLSLKLDLIDFTFPSTGKIRNISQWRDVRGEPDTKIITKTDADHAYLDNLSGLLVINRFNFEPLIIYFIWVSG